MRRSVSILCTCSCCACSAAAGYPQGFAVRSFPYRCWPPCAAAGVRAQDWNSWPEDAAGEGCAVLGKTADTVYLLRFASGIQYFPDIPESVRAYADFFRAGKDMLCSFLKLNAITEVPNWQSNYAREQLIRDELT